MRILKAFAAALALPCIMLAAAYVNDKFGRETVFAGFVVIASLVIGALAWWSGVDSDTKKPK